MGGDISKYYGPLLGYIQKRVHLFEDAEDLTQEVFLKLSKSDLNSIGNVKAWMYKIAKNTIIDYYRSKKRKWERLENDFINESLDETNAIEELSPCIAPFIEKLPEEYRMLLKMSDLENIPQKVIAETMDMNYVTVRSKIQRGRKKLKEMFAECCQITSGGRGSIICHQKPSNCCNN
ncbi:sigma-70 family RNA polymerase sigma factor [Flagellimonas meridianipacifica]|uniref:RNA polymerase sigma-70 factor (ECF subfamily) n=1 Tax=Flagellimonas meridianipacifica TaxID=1080225 RepID=A0A2T0MFG7_9FLAO|nr:sigma-70 family RNA polymerase sigma factor [Allomuricauda pacifica]PRX56304.1 RNA polymerase sigma-70 factor (ECF subfamily) [Allomuricauda pacifica]